LREAPPHPLYLLFLSSCLLLMPTKNAEPHKYDPAFFIIS
jgi:hypothetical protein